MKCENIEYVMVRLQNIRKLAQLGARSEHNMEREIFKKINEDFIGPLDALSAELEIQEKKNG